VVSISGGLRDIVASSVGVMVRRNLVLWRRACHLITAPYLSVVHCILCIVQSESFSSVVLPSMIILLYLSDSQPFLRMVCRVYF
jgi:hypothetical protein